MLPEAETEQIQSAVQSEAETELLICSVQSLEGLRWTWVVPQQRSSPKHGHRQHTDGAAGRRGAASGRSSTAAEALLHIDFTGQRIGPEGASNLAAMLLRSGSVAKRLQRLSLHGNAIGAAASALWPALLRCTRLTDLDLRRCSLSQGSFTDPMFSMMMETVPIQRLYVSNNPLIGAAGVEVLATVLLRRGSELRELYLSNLGLTEDDSCSSSTDTPAGTLDDDATNRAVTAPPSGGAMALANLLQHSRTLRVLAINENRIGACGARALAAALPGSRLQRLCLSANPTLGTAGGQALAEAVQLNHTLTSLVLPMTLPHEQLMAARTAVEGNRRGKPLVAALQRLAMAKLFSERLNQDVRSEFIDELGVDVLWHISGAWVGPAARVMRKFARARRQPEGAYERGLRIAAARSDGGQGQDSAATPNCEYRSIGSQWVDNSAFLAARDVHLRGANPAKMDSREHLRGANV
jgi:hypothetical protein